ncbi:recombination mediator RecR [Marinigracilibium pacificum]|uniref:Recombination protein RecR n=1 Tax=Marinigracilibium pacificum TaxID=2729599 RepID=A0A848J2F2_9BACT|nr:recombination mediator RecR [Marinigracilibium pacificum]NMM48720.1 recombination protein RecR [Marinigracilibium pacificum]
MEYPSKLIENAVTEISRLPGIGKKTAFRLVMHLLRSEESASINLSESIVKLRTQTRYCEKCGMVSEESLCKYCASAKRDKSLLCLVEDIPDVIAIENTAQFNGVYHILGGLISPVNGIGPDDLRIAELFDRINDKENPVKEVILALSPTMEGDTTSFYLNKKLAERGVEVSTIARGVPLGGELEYADELTLGRSIVTRTKYS